MMMMMIDHDHDLIMMSVRDEPYWAKGRNEEACEGFSRLFWSGSPNDDLE